MKYLAVFVILCLSVVGAWADCPCINEPCAPAQCDPGSTAEVWGGVSSSFGDTANFGEWIVLDLNPITWKLKMIKIGLGEAIDLDDDGIDDIVRISILDEVNLTDGDELTLNGALYERNAQGEWELEEVMPEEDDKDIEILPTSTPTECNSQYGEDDSCSIGGTGGPPSECVPSSCTYSCVLSETRCLVYHSTCTNCGCGWFGGCTLNPPTWPIPPGMLEMGLAARCMINAWAQGRMCLVTIEYNFAYGRP